MKDQWQIEQDRKEIEALMALITIPCLKSHKEESK